MEHQIPLYCSAWISLFHGMNVDIFTPRILCPSNHKPQANSNYSTPPLYVNLAMLSNLPTVEMACDKLAIRFT